MLWPDEVRTPDFAFLDEDVEVREQELKMAGSLIETMSGDFDPSQFKDEYREALEQVIEAKVAGRDVVAPKVEQPSAGSVVDLMAALRASVAAAKSKGSPADGTSDGKVRAVGGRAGGKTGAKVDKGAGEEQDSDKAVKKPAKAARKRTAKSA
jgi:DNA end-binding protein Ku